MLDASQPEVASFVFDGVRTRAFFLDSLTHAERLAFASKTLSTLEDYLATALEYEARAESAAGPFAALAARGAVLNARARVAWIREVLDAVRNE